MSMRTWSLGATTLGVLSAAAMLLAADINAELGRKTTAAASSRPDLVQCANLIYGAGKTSVCFSPQFLTELGDRTEIATHDKFVPVAMEAPELFEHPFVVMTGEGAFTLTDEQRANLREYLTQGGFMVASAGCSNTRWANSFTAEIEQLFPDAPLKELDLSHPIFHTVHDIDALDCKKSNGQATLYGLELDGKIALVFSSDGLNDTGNAGANCCCCGGNEIRNARRVNVNLLAYALTH